MNALESTFVRILVLLALVALVCYIAMYVIGIAAALGVVVGGGHTVYNYARAFASNVSKLKEAEQTM